MTDQIVRRLEDRDDLSLVLLARGGEQRAFETLFARHRHRFVSLVVRNGFEPDEARLVFGRKLLACVEQFDPGRGAAFTTFLHAAVLNAVRDARRTRRRRRWVPVGTHDLEPLLLRASVARGGADTAVDEGHAFVLDALARLSPDEQLVIERIAFDRVPQRELARELGRSTKWVDNRYQSAKRALRRILPPDLVEGRSHRHRTAAEAPADDAPGTSPMVAVSPPTTTPGGARRGAPHEGTTTS